MKICYVPKRFKTAQLAVVDKVNEIADRYAADGYTLTLRQLYYRLVSANVIANTVKEYKRLGAIVSDARLAGLVDWEAIEDRTRNLKAVRNWASPQDAMNWLAGQYHIDMWDNQSTRLEVWIEKEALAGVFAPTCAELDVPFFCCRGYNSQSEAWRAANRAHRREAEGQRTVILHFGDHDPSGLDMTRDVTDRFGVFNADDLEVERHALNIGQVKMYKLPPNPARETDARYKEYRRKFGESSWELDALEPERLVALLTTAVLNHRDDSLWDENVAREKKETKKIVLAAKRMRG